MASSTSPRAAVAVAQPGDSTAAAVVERAAGAAAVGTSASAAGSGGGGAAAGAADGALQGAGGGGSSLPSVLQSLRGFMQVQEQRARHYARFNLGFRGYLANRQEAPFKSLMQELTIAFSQCSLKVKAIQAELQAAQCAHLAELLQVVQVGEREKLQFTLSLHALKQAASFSSFSWQKPALPEGAGEGAAWQLDAGGGLGAEQPAHAHDHSHSHSQQGQDADACCGGEGHVCEPAGVPEPTQEEFHAALHESIQQLDRCVASINDALEEIKYDMAELADEQA